VHLDLSPFPLQLNVESSAPLRLSVAIPPLIVVFSALLERRLPGKPELVVFPKLYLRLFARPCSSLVASLVR
jgi:hypothetical protein